MDQKVQPLSGQQDATNTQPGSPESTVRDKEFRNYERHRRQLRRSQCHFQEQTRISFRSLLTMVNIVLRTIVLRLRIRAIHPVLGLVDWLASQLQRLRISLVKASFLDEDE